MIKSSTEILREYAQIISEAQGEAYPETYDPNNDELAVDDMRLRDEERQMQFNDGEEENGIDLPDESMQEDEKKFPNNWDDSGGFEQQSSDPVAELATSLHIDDTKIDTWLKANNYEITPIGGLTNKQGKV